MKIIVIGSPRHDRVMGPATALGTMAAIAEVGSALFKIGSWVWKKIAFWREPDRELFLWNIGSEDRPATGDEIKEFVAGLDQVGPEGAMVFAGQNVRLTRFVIKAGRTYVWQVGSDYRPASASDLQDVASAVQNFLSDSSLKSIVCACEVRVLEVKGSDFPSEQEIKSQ